MLSFGGNRLTEIPATVGQLLSLQALVLCDNLIESIPSSIANLRQLKSLLLHKNRIKTLPQEIVTLKYLTEVRYNYFESTGINFASTVKPEGQSACGALY